MRVADVMQAIADRADTIDGLRCFGFPADSVVPPALMVGFPVPYAYDEATDGMGKIILPVWLAVPRTVDRATRDAIAAYCDASGPQSVKAVLESGDYSALGLTVNVDQVEFDYAYSVAEIGMPAAKFTVSIWGGGE